MNIWFLLIISDSPRNSTVFWTNSEIRQRHEAIGYRTIYHLVTVKVDNEETGLNLQASAPPSREPQWTTAVSVGAQTPCRTSSTRRAGQSTCFLCAGLLLKKDEREHRGPERLCDLRRIMEQAGGSVRDDNQLFYLFLFKKIQWSKKQNERNLLIYYHSIRQSGVWIV